MGPYLIPLRDYHRVIVAHAMIDAEDVEEITAGGYRWFMRAGYAYRNTTVQCKPVHFHMHRVIARAPAGLEVDHIDGNKLNNCRSNLRLCTRAQNGRNTRKPTTNTSGFKGVSFCRRTHRWVAAIKVDGKSFHLGRHSTAAQAAEVYRAAALHHFGEFASTTR